MDPNQHTFSKGFFSPRRIWLNIFFLIALAIILFINLISIRQLNKYLIANRWVFHTYQVMQASNQIFLNHLHAIAVTRGYLLTGDQSFLMNFDQIIKDMHQHFEQLKTLTKDNISQQNKIRKLQPLLNERTEILKKSILVKQSTQFSKLEENKLIFIGQNITNKIQSILDSIYEDEFSLLQFRTTSIENNYRSTTFIVLFMNLLSVFLLITIIILFNRQLTEQLILEEKRSRSQTLLKGIINGTNDFIAAVDSKLKYTAFNRTFEEEFKRIFGKKPIVGMSVKESLELVPTDVEPVLQLWERALSGEEFTIIEKFGKTDTTRNEYEVTFNPIFDDQNKLIGASHIARNVAKRFEEERALKDAKKEIEKSYSDLKKHDHEISMINEMNSALQSASSLDETLEMIKNYCSQFFSFSSGMLYLLNSSKNYLEKVITWNAPGKYEKVVLPDQCWALRQGKIYKYLGGFFRNLPCKHVLANEKIVPYMCVPLLAQNNIIGLMYLQIKDYISKSPEELNKLTEENEFLVENIAGHISLALANMKLQEALRIRSIRDTLTGLYNRSYLEESLYRDIERAKRQGIFLAIVMMDLDHFKNVNDSFGHEAGDLVLKKIGELLNKRIRGSDMVCRYGGEEFLIMFYDVSLKEAVKLCEEIRLDISRLDIYLGNTLIGPLTASFGIAMYPKDSEDSDKLITQADKALYESKNSGRNKVTTYQ